MMRDGPMQLGHIKGVLVPFHPYTLVQSSSENQTEFFVIGGQVDFESKDQITGIGR